MEDHTIEKPEMTVPPTTTEQSTTEYFIVKIISQ